jgi:hypothetical protein
MQGQDSYLSAHENSENRSIYGGQAGYKPFPDFIAAIPWLSRDGHNACIPAAGE